MNRATIQRVAGIVVGTMVVSAFIAGYPEPLRHPRAHAQQQESLPQKDLRTAVASASQDTFTFKPYEPIVIRSVLTVPEGMAAIYTDWDAPLPLRIRERAGEVFGWAPPGTYELEQEVLVAKVDNEKNIKLPVEKLTAVYTIIVEGSEPQPPKPTPPKPNPTEPPFPSTSLSFLIVKEARETGDLPASQRSIFTSAKLFQWANTNVKDAGGFYRIWDDDYSEDDLADVGQDVATAYRLATSKGEKLPFIAISNKEKGYLGPLPATIDDTINLLESYK